MGTGTVVLERAVIEIGAAIGEGAIINYGAVVTHDVVVGEFAHISPNAVVGAGGVMTKKVPPGTTAVGVPARPLEHS